MVNRTSAGVGPQNQPAAADAAKDAQLGELKKALAELELRVFLSDKKDLIQELRAERDRALQSAFELKTKIVELTSQKDQAAAESIALCDDSRLLQQRLSEAQHRVHSADEQARSALAAKNELQKRLDSCQVALRELSDTCARLKQTITRQEQSVLHDISGRHALEQDVESLTKQLKDAKRRIALLRCAPFLCLLRGALRERKGNS
jgi:chromosome segregation ATPase